MKSTFAALFSIALLTGALTHPAYSNVMPQCEAQAATWLQRAFPELHDIQTIKCTGDFEKGTRALIKVCNIRVKDVAKTFEIAMPMVVLMTKDSDGLVCEQPTYFHVKAD